MPDDDDIVIGGGGGDDSGGIVSEEIFRVRLHNAGFTDNEVDQIVGMLQA